MLCCCQPFQDPKSAANAAVNDGVTPFPGQRRPLLEAATPTPQTTGGAPLMVNVVIPAGMEAGQTIQVAAPDGSRTVSAIIPQGMAPGQSFYVSFPTATTVTGSTAAIQPSNAASSGRKDSPPVIQQGTSQPIFTPAAAPVMPPVASKQNTHANQSAAPFSQALDGPPPAGPAPAQSRPQQIYPPTNGSSQQIQQKLLLVNVPPGSAPGSTLYVQVPGENRTLAAKVPPGVTQFHVAYRPRKCATSAALPPPIPSPTPAPDPVPTTNTSGQKLILVRVPPGTAPGTTLHVEVPDEPGRILAAQVPPHVSEFQVAYVPRGPIPAYDVHPSAPAPAAMGSVLPYIGGAALAGAAGAAMYDHYHHPTYQDAYGNGYGDAYGDPGAYGGYGGDYDGDYGGGDYESGYSEF